MEKRFYVEGTDPVLDSFTLDEEKVNGEEDGMDERIKGLDSIQVGETFNSDEGLVFKRVQ